MKRRLAPLLPLLSACLLFALSACDGGSSGSGDPTQVSYAAALGVDLGAMNRSESGLYTQDLAVGTGATEVSIGRYLEVHYTGWLPDGTQFDSSRTSNKPFEFRFGYDRVIAGWEEGLIGMKAGGKRRLVIPSTLGYGAYGSPPAIPPHSVLVFDVEVLTAR
ncbi:FKBP-type peptidyl-prolyl cis-trans isomerase [Archangium violaceum]|uniref:Peptidyl-prolyl cis-trans isomerase n=1 Tax=Archangium violaceum Cb vi76 TaxID=1406225 RepID=A0A084STG9_9BACT|nr:FKBP-type peptidyl-prolyl cis-trans isomerase [Archangium violaceum]KFA91754.1 peptidylprolyl isomerase [Archangium violaceum Cb vi76]